MLEHITNRKKSINWLFPLMLVLLLWLSACQPKETNLPFETIEQKEWAGTDHAYEAREPGVMVVAQPEEITALNKWITEDAEAQLQKIDYKVYFVLVVFQGRKPTTGYSIQVDQLTRLEDTVNIKARFSEPKPNEEKSPEVTSPYHLVRVQKVGTWGRNITFNLNAGEVIVVSLSHSVP